MSGPQRGSAPRRHQTAGAHRGLWPSRPRRSATDASRNWPRIRPRRPRSSQSGRLRGAPRRARSRPTYALQRALALFTGARRHDPPRDDGQRSGLSIMALCASAGWRRLPPSATRPSTTRTNGKAERLIQTLLREWPMPRPYSITETACGAIRPWLRSWVKGDVITTPALGYQPAVESGYRLNNVFGLTAIAFAMPAPMPLAAPVTSATLPVREPVISVSSRTRFAVR